MSPSQAGRLSRSAAASLGDSVPSVPPGRLRIAHGGSGFAMLERNTTQFDTGISIRDVVREAMTQVYDLPDYDANIAVEDGRIIPVFDCAEE